MRRIVQASLASGRLLALAVAGILAAGPVIAASANVEAAVKSLAKIEADAGKFQAYCKLIQDMDDVPEQDTAKADALETQLQTLIDSMGSDVAQAWDLAADTDPQSEDGKAFEAAFAALEDKCP
jgi:hypothetical protein